METAQRAFPNPSGLSRPKPEASREPLFISPLASKILRQGVRGTGDLCPLGWASLSVGVSRGVLNRVPFCANWPLGASWRLRLMFSRGHGDVLDLEARGSPVWSMNISIFRFSGQFKSFSGIFLCTCECCLYELMVVPNL